jgi:hypothetical protein
MKISARYSAMLATIALATGIGTGAALFIFAHDGSQSLLDMCPFASSEATEESSFMAENGAAMEKMMNDMAVKPTGDVDADFVAVMVPHHQGAIAMARAVLRYGRNSQIKRLAQEIIVTQQQEIAVMRLAVGGQLPPSFPSPTQLSARTVLDNRCRAAPHETGADHETQSPQGDAACKHVYGYFRSGMGRAGPS